MPAESLTAVTRDELCDWCSWQGWKTGKKPILEMVAEIKLQSKYDLKKN